MHLATIHSWQQTVAAHDFKPQCIPRLAAMVPPFPVLRSRHCTPVKSQRLLQNAMLMVLSINCACAVLSETLEGEWSLCSWWCWWCKQLSMLQDGSWQAGAGAFMECTNGPPGQVAQQHNPCWIQIMQDLEHIPRAHICRVILIENYCGRTCLCRSHRSAWIT